MREKYAVSLAVGAAAVAIGAGITFATVGGVFGSGVQDVSPPPINGVGVANTLSPSASVAVSIPPSPTWRIAPERTTRPPLSEPSSSADSSSTEAEDDESTTASRSSRTTTETTENRNTRDEGDEDEQDDDEQDEDGRTTTGIR